VRAKRLVVLLACGALAGCAAILGIDDGTPRTGDASADAGGDAAGDAAGDVREAAADHYSPLHCGGDASCDFGSGQSCCWDGGDGFACVGSPQACDAIYIPCDRPEQCAQAADAEPNVCCANYADTEAGAVATAVACLPASQCNSGVQRFVLCGDDSGVECEPADASCGPSSYSLPTFLICK